MAFDGEALITAAKQGDLPRFKQLAEAGVPLTVVASWDEDACYLAAAAGHLNILRYLAEQGGDLDHRSSIGWSPLLVAVQNRHRECVEFLVDAGVDLTVCSHQGTSLLKLAAADGRWDLFVLLVNAGAPLPKCDSPNMGKIVQAAAEQGKAHALREVLDRVPLSQLPKAVCESAKAKATEAGHENVLALLRGHTRYTIVTLIGLGLHERVGRDSAIFRSLRLQTHFDWNVLREVLDLLALV